MIDITMPLWLRNSPPVARKDSRHRCHLCKEAAIWCTGAINVWASAGTQTSLLGACWIFMNCLKECWQIRADYLLRRDIIPTGNSNRWVWSPREWEGGEGEKNRQRARLRDTERILVKNAHSTDSEALGKNRLRGGKKNKKNNDLSKDQNQGAN